MDHNLNLLGMAKKAGRLEIGEEPVGASARGRKAKLLLLAADAAENTARRATHFGEAGKVPVLTTPYTKAQLGGAVGRTSCAMLALTDAGFAAAFAAKLATQSPETYGQEARQLEEKAEKVLQRQREQRQHEKNLERGKKRPWFLAAQKTEGKRPTPQRGEPPAARQGETSPGKPTGKPTGKPMGSPTGKPGETSPGKPFGKPTGKSFGKPTGKPMGSPTGKPGETSPSKPFGKPTGKSFGKPTGKPVGGPTGKPAGKPAGKPTGKPAGKPAGKSKS